MNPLLCTTFDMASHLVAERSREAERQAGLEELRQSRIAIQRRSLAAIAAIADERERRTVAGIDDMLGRSLGSAEGYLGELGLGATRRLQATVAGYGITPDYDGVRHLAVN